MIILGVTHTVSQDNAAAIIVDGELVAATGQERVDRHKNSGAFPWDAISDVLYHAGVRPKDVDRIVFGSHFTPATALRRLPQLHSGAKATASQFSPLLNAYIAYQVAMRDGGLWPLEADLSRKVLGKRLSRRGFSAPVTTLEHHAAHAYSVYRSQPHLDAIIFTLDAMGDGTGAIMLDGKMEDDASVKQCRVVLELARELSARDPELAEAYDL